MPSDAESPSSKGMNIPDSVRLIPEGAVFRLFADEVRWNTEEENPPGGGDLRPSLNSLPISSSSSSSSSMKNIFFPDGFDGRRVSCDDDGDMTGLLYECFMAVSVGSGVSSRYFSVVGGSIFMLFLSRLLVLLLRIGLRFFVAVVFIMIPSSESLSLLNMSESISSSPSPLTSTAMHCSTCSLKWMCFRSLLGDKTPEFDDDGPTLSCSRLIRRDEKGKVT